MSSKKKVLEHIACLVVLILINVIYFYPQLEGKVLQQGDIVSSTFGTKALINYQKENNKTYLWNPAQFGGMPVLSGPPSKNNYVFKIYSFLKLGFNEPIGLFLAASIMAYLMFVILGLSPWLALIFAIPTALATFNLILWEAGHNSKMRTLIFTPLLIAGVLSLFEYRKYVLGFILLSLGFSFSFFARHPQMTYYILLVFLIYALIILYQTYKSKDWLHFGKGAGIVVASVLLGLATSATTTWSLYDYSKSTMRGDAILEADASNAAPSSSNVDGLDWTYATEWSNDIKDLIATYIPGFVGGGGREKVSRDSETYKNYQISQAPLYWGRLPFTDGPIYQGAGILFLFVLGLMLVKGNIKWWLGIGLLWMYLLSMGRYFEGFNQIIFNYFPFYSAFRAPQTVLNITPFFITILAGLSVKELLAVRLKRPKKKKSKSLVKAEKSTLISFAICGSIALFFALFGTLLFDFTGPGDARYTQQGIDLAAFISDRKSLMQSDSWRTFFIVGLLALSIYGYLKGKIGKTILITGVGLIVVLDIFLVNLRYFSHDTFVRKAAFDQTFEERAVDLQIKSLEPDRARYRVHDLTINTFNSSQASAFHNTIGGYHPAKLQRYQDLIDRHIGQNNIQVLNMLNTKYFIVSSEEGQPVVQSNVNALGNAWFVANVAKASTPNEEIDALSRMNTANSAVVLDQDFPGYLDGLTNSLDSNATISLVQYEPDMLTYESVSDREMLAVFSEIWYGPNKGWQVYIDDQPVDHIRANYALRALRVPAGQHTIRFEFRPNTFYTGEKISLASSLILILVLLGYLGMYLRDWLRPEQGTLSQ